MSLKIIRQGLLDTIQDLGRKGYQHLGMNPGGAMDSYAAQAANFLVGNDRNTAVIEMHFPAPVLQFTRPALIAVSGADFQASLNTDPIPAEHPVLINKNSILQFNKLVSGARAYLAIRGGFAIDKWMNSFSTNVKAGAGGFNGRALLKNDEIGFKTETDPAGLTGEKDFRVLPWSSGAKHYETEEIFITRGHEWDRLAPEGKENFLDMNLVINQHSDRMAYHLDHVALPVIDETEIISSSVNFGTIQLLPGGKTMILMADHQTMGGYPRIAHAISAHHSLLAQKKPGEKIRFVMTRLETAEQLLFTREQQLLQLQNACKLRLAEIF